MSPAIVEHDVTVYQGDACEQLAAMPERSVNCVVTSPPYFGLRDYGVDGQIGLEATPSEYVAEMVAVFAAVRGALTDDGVVWLNLGDSYNAYNGGAGPGSKLSKTQTEQRPQLPSGFGLKVKSMKPKDLLGIPWRVAFALQDDGWYLRNAIIWAKPNGMPESITDRLSTKHEYVFLLAKSQRYWFDLDAVREPLARVDDKPRPIGGRNLTPRHIGATDNTGWKDHDVVANPLGRNPGDVWTIATSPFPGAHFATMPPELARRCILAGCPADGTVLDPFAGSGTTLKVARALGRKSVGIELNPDYIEIIRDRIGQTPLDFGASA